MSGNLKDDNANMSDDDDVELDGMDLEGIDDEEEETDAMRVDTPITSEPDTDVTRAALAKEEDEEMEAARRERMELLEAEAGKKDSGKGDVSSKFEYLLQQSDVFAHFLAGSVAANTEKKKKSKKKNGGRGRTTEAEEDAALLKTAQSKVRVVRLTKQPACLWKKCEMRDYQLEGLNWLIKLHDHDINGILADEMGLGKTLQTISMLAYLRESRGVNGPHLVIVPKSVLGNWIREFNQWCPVIKAVRMGGTKAERKHFVDNYFSKDGKLKFDVLVTSYEAMLKEKGRLGRISWKYLIIDEAHRIKRPTSALSRAVRLMDTQFRLLITGTPLQNDLQELWALLNFIMPSVFGDAEYFDKWFSLTDESGKENVISRLHSVLRPFMLRRIKSDVAKHLPPKTETKLFVGLTDMQQEWYKRCLHKELVELNKIGGPSRSGLLNVLMQLRKVCNHPYLFDGAEQGPPYTDGPHLWENAAKLQLLHKLLPKLKEKGSRVLIFSQMTRVLDILSDYLSFNKYEFCRIDGNTDGEKRDAEIDDFNGEGSSKFVFLLSTRAGGLGINLATADIVILFDSDWNPQVDLQAMDRAHRIGQKKPVQVFRLITEQTVEEKIIERADRKLFLDAAVIQQGRLAEQHSSLEKGELMKMVRFGADEILHGKDDDIDALISKGEERTSAMQAQLETDAKHNLANFSLLADDGEGTDTFDFGGKNYREERKAGGGLFINLPQRQRKRNYDLNALENNPGLKFKKAEGAAKKKRKGRALSDFQLFDLQRINELDKKEKDQATKKDEEIAAIAQMRQDAIEAPAFGSGVAPGRSKEELLQEAEYRKKQLGKFGLSEADQIEKTKLLAEGFPDWNVKDFKTFCASLEMHGRYNFKATLNDMMNQTGKDKKDIQRYYVAFWTNYQRIAEWPKILERIEKGEKKIVRLRFIRHAIHERVERHLEETYKAKSPKTTEKGELTLAEMLQHAWPAMKIKYGNNSRGKGYQEQEDAFLVCMMYRHGYGAAERIRMEIRRAWQFRFDWYFKSRSAEDIQKRCDFLVRVIEKENEDIKKQEQKDASGKENQGKPPPAPKNPPTGPSASAAKAPPVQAG